MSAVADVVHMSTSDKIAEGMRRSLPYLPAESRGVVESMLKPETMAIIAATLAVWAGSHFLGVGEIVDIVLLGVGVVTLGFAVFEGADAFRNFVSSATGATSNDDLEKGGKYFAQAVTLLGLSVIQALLLRGQGKIVAARGAPRTYPMPNVGPMPAAGNKLIVSRPAILSSGILGKTSPFGEITIARNQTLTEQRITLFHELVHRYFSPRTGPLRRLRAEIRMSGYARSAFLRYLEEALAEGYGQLRMHGLARALGAYRFPLMNGYVTISELAAEGTTIGTIVLGGVLFHVSISHGALAHD